MAIERTLSIIKPDAVKKGKIGGCLQLLEAAVAALGLPAYRAKQLFRWLHQKGARSFEEMTDLPEHLRASLKEKTGLGSLEIAKKEVAKDGTRKYALRTSKGDVVEAVFI